MKDIYLLWLKIIWKITSQICNVEKQTCNSILKMLHKVLNNLLGRFNWFDVDFCYDMFSIMAFSFLNFCLFLWSFMCAFNSGRRIKTLKTCIKKSSWFATVYQPDSQGLHLCYPRYDEDPDTGHVAPKFWVLDIRT